LILEPFPSSSSCARLRRDLSSLTFQSQSKFPFPSTSEPRASFPSRATFAQRVLIFLFPLFLGQLSAFLSQRIFLSFPGRGGLPPPSIESPCARTLAPVFPGAITRSPFLLKSCFPEEAPLFLFFPCRMSLTAPPFSWRSSIFSPPPIAKDALRQEGLDLPFFSSSAT